MYCHRFEIVQRLSWQVKVISVLTIYDGIIYFRNILRRWRVKDTRKHKSMEYMVIMKTHKHIARTVNVALLVMAYFIILTGASYTCDVCASKLCQPASHARHTPHNHCCDGSYGDTGNTLPRNSCESSFGHRCSCDGIPPGSALPGYSQEDPNHEKKASQPGEQYLHDSLDASDMNRHFSVSHLTPISPTRHITESTILLI